MTKEILHRSKSVGRIDRVDEIVLDENQRKEAIADGVLSETIVSEPMTLGPGPLPPANRLVVIRDLKTINGPKINEQGNRHRRGLFDDATRIVR